MNEIMKIIANSEELPAEVVCASLCYEMARQEMETNSGYALAFAYIIGHADERLSALAESYGDDIMKDESQDHAVKLRNLGDWFAGLAPIEAATIAAETEGI